MANVASLLEKLDHLDADYRFMALSDLGALLAVPEQARTLERDEHLSTSIVVAVMDKLDDPVSDVQSQAVKLLESLAPALSDKTLSAILGLLIKRVQQDHKDSQSITYMALRTVVCFCRASNSAARIVADSLFSVLRAAKTPSIDVLDVVIEFLKRFGSTLTSQQIDTFESYLLEVLSSGKGLVRKRAAVALGYMARYLSNAKWDALVSYIVDGLTPQTDRNTAKTLVFLAGVIAKADPSRFHNSLGPVFAKVREALSIDTLSTDDPSDEGLVELREASLAALDAIVSLGTQIESVVSDLVLIISEFVSYDPNYAGEGDDDKDEDDSIGGVEQGNGDAEFNDDADSDDGDGLDEFDEFDEFESEFSDDEDQSWKLRRYAFKLCAGLASSCPSSVPTIYSQLGSTLLRRLRKEREETVTLEAVNTFGDLVSAAAIDGPYYTSRSYRTSRRRGSDASMAEGDPMYMLESMAPKLVKTSKLLISRPKSTTIAHSTLTKIVQNLVVVLGGSLSDEDLQTIVSILQSLSSTKNTMQVDILRATRAVLTHASGRLDSHQSILADIVIQGIRDPYYKVSGEALDVAVDYFAASSQGQLQRLEEFRSSIVERASSNSNDLDTREKAINALAKLLTVERDLSGAGVLLDLISNEALRMVCVNAVETLASVRDVCSDIPQWTATVLETLGSFLRQSSKQLRLNTLSALTAIAHGKGKDLDPTLISSFENVCNDTLAHAEVVLSGEGDGPLLSVILGLLADLCSIVPSRSSDMAKVGIEVAVRGSSIAIPAKNQLLRLFQSISSNSTVDTCDVIVANVDNASSKSDGDLDLLSELTAVVLPKTSDPAGRISGYVKLIDSRPKWALMVLGNAGRRNDIGIDTTPIVQQFDAQDESIRPLAARALGEIASCRLDQYLDQILNGVNSDKVFLYLTAVREVILAENVNQNQAARIWKTLIALNLEKVDDAERATVAECIGRLSILGPEQFLPELESYLISDNWLVRITALSAVKYSFGQAHDRYDTLLRPIIVNFFGLVEDDRLEIREVALETLISAIHNKLYLVTPHLSRLLPILYEEMVVNDKLIRTVQMGPFKHKVDDGLDLRKTAFEAIYTLVSTLNKGQLQSVANLDVLLERVIQGLSDEHNIRVLSCVIIGRLAKVNLNVLVARGGLEEIVGKFNGMLGAQVKENAIKQEHEKQVEILRNVQRTSHEIDAAIQQALKGGESPLSDVELATWSKYMSGVQRN
uniref:ARAD1D07986p n=1 Tax=Blastobotrys adeninivorans TaxID=409370 RepID=A0A060T850_BLAAD